jgi:murein DD-endopeptidase MepM/ murein hydrolase activator NlpD
LNHNKLRRFTCVIILTCLICSSQALAEDKISQLNNQKQGFETDKKDYQTKLDQYKNELQPVKDEIKQLSEELIQFDKSIERTTKEIDQTNVDIENTSGKIEKLKENIRQSEIELDAKKDILSRNLRTMYSKGDTNSAEFLFRSGDVSDFLYRFDALKEIAKANQHLFQEVKAKINSLKDNKTVLDQEILISEQNKNKLETLKSGLNIQKQDQLSTIGNLAKKQELLENGIANEEKAIQEMNLKIAAAMKRIKEERIRKEEEARRNKWKPPVITRGTGQFQIPIAADSYVISSPFGWRIHPITGVRTYHNGVDFAAPRNTPIYAADDGVVLFSGPASGFGNWIVIDHQNGYFTIYGHMYDDGLYVKEGDSVRKGEKIGGVGSNGGSTGNHLHFALADNFDGSNFNYVDPMPRF